MKQAWKISKQDKTGNIRINGTLKRVRLAIVAVEKQCALHIPSVSVTLVIQHARRIRRIILSHVTCLALPHFSTLSYKRHDFRREELSNQKCVLIFSQLVSETFLILRRIKRGIVNVGRSLCDVLVILVGFE